MATGQVFTGQGWEVRTESLARVLTIFDEFEAVLVTQAAADGQRSDAGHLGNLVTMLDNAINIAMQEMMGVMYGQPGGNAPAITINAGYEVIKTTVAGLGRAKPTTLSSEQRQAVADAITVAKQAAIGLDR